MKAINPSLTLTICLLFFFGIKEITAQHVKTTTLSVKSKQIITWSLGSTASSIAIQIPLGQRFNYSYLVAEQDTFFLRQDAHAEDGKAISELLVFSKPVTSLTLSSASLTGELTVTLLNVPPLTKPIFTNLRVVAECDKPNVIPSSTWRSGLTPPKELPVATTVKHIIVHHAAGSNTATNYTDVVRNIYVYHTESNGWNDVGYNFLIAQDGTVYEGRDGQGKMDGDNVLGAHFCSQNTGTMGLCLLGDYMTAQPASNAISSLEKLIAWKMKKENLDPLGKALHTASSKVLMNISGHRDGSCSTDCPGDNLYIKLPTIRQDVPLQCSILKPLTTEPDADWAITVSPNPTNNQITVRSPQVIKGTFGLYNSKGQSLFITALQENSNKVIINAPNLSDGVYMLQLMDGERRNVQRVLIKQ